MPYKFNEARRHKIPKAKYKVTNWPDYEASLRQRGGLTVWFTEEAVAAWAAAPRTTRLGDTAAVASRCIGAVLTVILGAAVARGGTITAASG